MTDFCLCQKLFGLKTFLNDGRGDPAAAGDDDDNHLAPELPEGFHPEGLLRRIWGQVPDEVTRSRVRIRLILLL